ncbi:MAG: MFS transporter, partial [Bacteroidales bacterium]
MATGSSNAETKSSSSNSEPTAPLGLPSTVWFLGFGALLNDTASEAIYPLLPLFLTTTLGAGAFSLGVIEGTAEAANSLLKIFSGYFTDRWKRRRGVVVAGYALAAFIRPFIGLVRTWPQLLAIRFTDRIGKGIRGAPRDAMLAGWATPETRGKVFGFERAMDHVGAVLGPSLATLFLLAYPGRYRLLFAATIVPGVLAVLMVSAARERRVEPSAPCAGPTPAVTVGSLPPRLYGYLAVLLLFTLGNSTDAFLLLRLSGAGVAAFWIPLLWAALHVVKATTSVVGGTLSDRWSRRSVIGAGWLVYAMVYAGFAVSQSVGALIAWFMVYGFYYGLSESAEKALVADFAPPHARGTAFG